MILARLHAFLERISRVAVWIGGGALLLCAFMVSIDVVMRKLFSITMSGSDEISGYAFAAATAWAYSYALLHRSHIRIDALYGVLPLWARSILDAVGLALLLYYMAYLTNKAVDVLLTSWEHDSVSITTLSVPQWIPQLLWVGGLCWFVITLAFMLVYVLVSLVRGDVTTVQNVAGALSAEKKIDEETQGMDGMRGAG
jgi:TRAP-type C4-dicarboxylate transport system permease small subunit